MSPIASMTAFARKSHETSIGTLTCELRSVNHRYLDLSLYLAEPLRVHEKEIREYLQHHLSRGKVDLGIKFQPSLHQAIQFELNTELTNKLAEVSHELSGTFKNVQINLMDLLSWPGVLKTAEIDISDLKNSVMALLKVSVEELIATRQREGASIYAFLDQCLASIATHREQIKERLPQVLKNQRDRIVGRFSELELSLDPARLEQEFVWLAQKTDIAEELQRLEAHVHEVQRILSQGGVVGRRLDFLMQELNREANTIGSKSVDSAVTQADVELKVLIEQMREQVQNLE